MSLIIEGNNFLNISFMLNSSENENNIIIENSSAVIDDSFGLNPFIESSPDERLNINIEDK